MSTPVPEILSNPHGGAVRAAVSALHDARRTLDAVAPARALCEAAARAFGEAGWLPAQRYTQALAQALREQAVGASHGVVAAFDALLAALERRNLWEIACSPTLWSHYLELIANTGRSTSNAAVAAGHAAYLPWHVADYALAGRPLPRAVLHAQEPGQVARVRAEVEALLLGALRAEVVPRDTQVALTVALSELAGPHPYDFWRLAAACVRVQQAATPLVKQWLARLNLLLAEHARGGSEVEAALLRLTLALLWRDYALHGATADDAADVELLRDYGLEVPVRAAQQAGAGAAALWDEPENATSRELGPVLVDARAFEDFLQTADAALAELPSGVPASPGMALQAAAAASRVGAAAWTLGLGQTALLGDALGLAWRHGVLIASHDAAAPAANTVLVASSAETLRAALYKMAAGLPPPDLGAAREALAAAFAAPA